MEDFEYELRKNGGPSAEKCHARNRLMDRQLKHVPNFNALVKLYHTDPKVEYISKEEQNKIENKLLADDLEPCVVYSLNKKSRWELLSNIGEDTLQDLEDANGGLATIVLERNLSDYYPLLYTECNRAYQNVIGFSQCKTSHKLEKEDGEERTVYRRRTVRGLGQTYPSFSDREKDKTKNSEGDEEEVGTIVTYNVVTIPKNFKKLFDKHCIRKYSLKYPDFLMYDMDSGHWWIDHELAHSSDAFDEQDSRKTGSGSVAIQKEPSPKCYNLEEHIVSKPKQNERRRNQRSRKNTTSSTVSSDFSIISGDNIG